MDAYLGVHRRRIIVQSLGFRFAYTSPRRVYINHKKGVIGDVDPRHNHDEHSMSYMTRDHAPDTADATPRIKVAYISLNDHVQFTQFSHVISCSCEIIV